MNACKPGSLFRYAANIPKNPVRVIYEKYPSGGAIFEELDDETAQGGLDFGTRAKVVRLLIGERVFEGSGSTLKQAKRRAAKKAVDSLTIT